MKAILLASGAGLLALPAPVPAFAGPAPAPIVQRVPLPHRDVDLATPVGARVMLERIETTAARACGGPPAPGAMLDSLAGARRRDHRRCKIAAIDAATLRLDAPLVRAAWLGREDAARARQARQEAADLLRAAGLAVPPELAADSGERSLPALEAGIPAAVGPVGGDGEN